MSEPEAPTSDAAQLELDVGGQLTFTERRVPLARIRIDDTAVWGSPPDQRMAESVRRNGILLPVILREMPPRHAGDEAFYQIVDGRRRYQAAQDADLKKLPARIITSGNPDVADPIATLVANDNRSPNPVSELAAIELLMARNASEQQISRATGLSVGTINARLRLSGLIPELREAWEEGRISAAVGARAAKLDEEAQRKLAAVLAEHGRLTGRDVTAIRRVGADAAQSALPGAMFDVQIPWRARVADLLAEAKRILAHEAGRDGGELPAADAVATHVERALDEVAPAREVVGTMTEDDLAEASS